MVGSQDHGLRKSRKGSVGDGRSHAEEPLETPKRGGPGTLHVIATPIGNLEDITIRAIRVLKEVRLIAAEDTRQTRILLDRYQIATPLISLYDQNELKKSALLLERLRRGDDVAYVSDAGTPGISDPGYLLVREAISHGIRVTPVPGASALIAALSVSGLPMDSFLFLGFLPSKAMPSYAASYISISSIDRAASMPRAPRSMMPGSARRSQWPSTRTSWCR